MWACLGGVGKCVLKYVYFDLYETIYLNFLRKLINSYPTAMNRQTLTGSVNLAGKSCLPNWSLLKSTVVPCDKNTMTLLIPPLKWLRVFSFLYSFCWHLRWYIRAPLYSSSSCDDAKKNEFDPWRWLHSPRPVKLIVIIIIIIPGIIIYFTLCM